MRQLVLRAIAQFSRQQSASLPDKLAKFDDVLLKHQPNNRTDYDHGF